MKWLALLVLSTGCAQVLGLENTTLDAGKGVDAPSVCDGAPACNFASGRSVCGQLYGTGAMASQPIRVDAPTGEVCPTPSTATDGPCAFTVTGMAAPAYFAGSTMGQTPGLIDDCGRFVVPDLDPTIPDVAVFFSNQNGFKNNATIVVMRDPASGADQGIEAYAVSDATAMAWSTQLTTGTAVDTSAGYLVRYTRNGVALDGEQVAKDMGTPLSSPPGSVPWGAFFTDPFGTLDPALTGTAPNGTALAVLGSGTFSLEGYHLGHRCRVVGLQQVANTFIFVLPKDC